MKKVKVEVWSDFVCPWCWIAKRRLDKATQKLAGQVDVIVVPKAYRLGQGAATGDYTTVLYQKFGSADAADRMMSAVVEGGLMEGLTYNFDTMRFGDTSAAHALVKSIESPEHQLRMIERIYQAVTTDGIDIFDKEVLRSLAKEIGFSTIPVDFDSPHIVSEIARDELEANQIANGVPLFVFGNKFQLSGARDVATFEKALLEAATEVPPLLDDFAGTSCSIRGCAG